MNIRSSILSSLFGFVMLISWTHAQQEKIDFAHDILPTLKKRCASCHSNGTYKGGFSIDRRDTLIDSGAVELGDSENSDLIERILSKDKDYQMPPEGERLTRDEVKKFSQWIDQDLAWTEGFSFKKKKWKASMQLVKPTLPKGNGNPIDLLLASYFERHQIKHPPVVDDSIFIRRVYLDLIGILPTIEEQNQFTNNKEKNKRSALIRRLLGRRRDFADHWMSFWNDLLRNDYAGTGFIDGGRKQITQWLHRSLYENKPYDQMVRELISPPNGESDGFIRGIQWRGRVNASQVREVQFAQNVSQVFLGENLKCASCHDSFINDWKLADAYGMAAIIADRPLEMYRCDQPTGKKAEAKFLWPELGEIDPGMNRTQRLEAVAKLITKKENGRFARTIVNRIWQRMMGRGLVEPVDMMSNRPFDESLLDFLALHLMENQYDLKKTMSLIANSKIYQARTVSESKTPADDWVFRGPMVRRMSAEQFMDSVWYLADAAPSKPNAVIANYDGNQVSQRFLSKWIWNRKNARDAKPQETVVFELDWDIKKVPKQSEVIITCDNLYVLIVNGKKLKQDSDWTNVESIPIGSALIPGKNRIEIIAKNLGDSENPAGLYFTLIADRQKIDVPIFYRQEKERKPAVPIESQSGWKTVHASIFDQEQKALGKRPSGKAVRASLVVSDQLMRSLGRPNREQVVTSRVDQLSTLQALDLSNGKIFYELMEKAAERIIRQSKSESKDKIVTRLFQKALCRNPTEAEIQIVQRMLGQKLTRESVADTLWTLIMLPEFQHVR